MNKPGYKTTEFWGSGTISIVGALAALGVIDKDTGDGIAAGVPPLVQAIDALVAGIIKIIGLTGAIIAQVKYNQGRANTKAAPDKVYIKK